jgi:hypothetical protein
MIIANFLLEEISGRTVGNPIPTRITNTLDKHFLIMVTVNIVKTTNEAATMSIHNQITYVDTQTNW